MTRIFTTVSEFMGKTTVIMLRLEPLFSGKSLMSLALTTTHENSYFQRSEHAERSPHRRAHYYEGCVLLSV